MLEELETASY